MKQATYEDAKGRMWAVLLPEGVSDSDASMGIPVGPPSLESLFNPEHIGTLEEIEVRLHNQLFHRNLLTARDVKLRRKEVLAALISTFKVGVQAITRLYAEPKAEAIPQRRKETKLPTKRQTGKKEGGK